MLQSKNIFENSTAFIQILILLALITVSLLFIYLLAVVSAIFIWGKEIIFLGGITEINFNNQEVISFLKYIQIVGQFAIFIIPPLIFSFLVYRNVFQYLNLKKEFNFIPFILSVVLIYINLPFISWLGSINQKLVLPDFFSGIENWMKISEENATQQMKVFLDVKTTGAILLNFVMIALIPSVGEELLFRGVLIRVFEKGFKSIHLAVIISSILFSSLHLQFYGFLPRLVLGLLFGYIFIWTANLWIPIILHFLNNATVLIVYYISKTTKHSNTSFESFGSSNHSVTIIMSAIFTFILLFLIYKNKKTEVKTL